jgi:hypothetical protein
MKGGHSSSITVVVVGFSIVFDFAEKDTICFFLIGRIGSGDNLDTFWQ